MKQVVLLAWLLLLFTACQKHEEEIAPADRPDARLQEVLTAYKAQLTGAEHGWKAMLYPKTGEVYSFLLKFTPDDRVIMTGDINAATTIPAESSYRLKAMQLPSLLFDTFSHLHVLADPSNPRQEEAPGQGRYVDFEFNFESATAETIVLNGQYHGSKLVLTKASQAQAASYASNIGPYVGAFERLNSFVSYFKHLSIGTKTYDIQVNTHYRTLLITYFTGETAQVFSTGFYFTDEGMVLLEPFTHQGLTISMLRAPQFNTAGSQLHFTVDNVAATIRQADRPVKVDVQGARDFFNASTGDDYWLSPFGFTIRGVEDSLKLSQFADYRFVAFWPRFGTSNNMVYDLFGIVKQNAEGGFYLAHGPAAVSQVSSDGRIIYNYLGTFGNIPAQELPAVTASRQLWTDPQGFYVVRTGNNSVDLVSAKDGQAWLSLFR